MLKAILFDFDGTLANTNPLIIRSFTETFKELLPNQSFTENELLDCIGPTLLETGKKYHAEKPEVLVETYRRYCWKYHDEMITIYPGIEEMLIKLKAMDLKLVIVTSKELDTATRGLEVTRILKYFDWIVSADDVINPKPHQEPIEKVLNYYGFKPEECMMVGDNAHDILCAKAANVTSIAVGWALRGADYLKKFSPNYIIEEANDLVKIANLKLTNDK